MAGVSKTPSGKWRASYTNAQGQRVQFVGTRDRRATLALATRLETEARDIRLGIRPPLTPQELHATQPLDEVITEYLAWGQFHGGRRGRPWSAQHARNRRYHLTWWQSQLTAQTLAQLPGILPQVEQALRQLQAGGASGKTLKHHVEALSSFCAWCVKRDYLSQHPLQALGAIDATPQTTRRALTPEEIQRLLTHCAPHRRVLYATAMATGLRAGELRQLTPAHLDTATGALRLDAAWTKNRKPGLQLLPWGLVLDLANEAHAHTAARHYLHVRAPNPPLDPLLYVPRGPGRELRKDLEAAGIAPTLPSGKVDFHALRAVYVSLVFEAGADLKQAQDLARLDTATLAVETYARSRPALLRPLVEAVWQHIAGETENAYTGADIVRTALAVGESPVAFLAHPSSSVQDESLAPRLHTSNADQTHTPHLTVIPGAGSSAEPLHLTDDQQTPVRGYTTSGADFVHGLPPDLQTLIAAWPDLAPAVRQQIVALVRGEVPHG